MAEMTVRMIPVKKIHPNPNNPRYEAGDVSGLAESIRQEGRILQPLLVIEAASNPIWLSQFGPGAVVIEDGYRRWVAGKEVLKELPCIVQAKAHPSESVVFRELVTALITDVHKEYLPAMDRAKAYGRLRDELNMTQAQIAQRLGVDTSTVSRYLSLLELSDKSQQAVRTGRLTVEDAIAAIQKHRAQARRKKGQMPIDAGWEPDHLGPGHHLAKKARVMCDAREHNSRRRLGGTACGACWETVIRQDEARAIAVQIREQSGELSPITADGSIRVG